MKVTIKAAWIKGICLILATIITGVISFRVFRNGIDNSVKTGDQHDGFFVGGDIIDSTININVDPSEIEETKNMVEDVNVALEEHDQRTSGIEKLPDGRTRIGFIITGSPTIVLDEHKAAATFYREKDFVSALEHSERAIQAYEETQQEVAKMNRTIKDGDLNKSAAAKIYYLGAYCAHKLKKHEQAYQRAEKANSIESHPELIKLLAVTLFNVNRKTDALQIIDDGLVQYPNNPILINIRNELSKRELFRRAGSR